ncbi:MAG TPA: PH domain-containing protein [Patescibacteria group bacterium]
MENNNKKSSAFYSYCLNPQIKFDTYEEGEKIYLLLRSHPFTQIGWVLSSIFFFILLFVLNLFLQSFLNLGQILIINIFFIVFIFSYIWFNILNWYFNAGIVTSKRVIDIDFYAILYKEITVAQLGKIEDITVKSGGYFESLFNYGSIFIQTAGTEANVEFIDVPYPSEAIQIINKLLSEKNGQ